jgi:hypothetical protein
MERDNITTAHLRVRAWPLLVCSKHSSPSSLSWSRLWQLHFNAQCAKGLSNSLSRKSTHGVISNTGDRILLNRLECHHTFCYNCLISFFHQCIRTRLSFRSQASLLETFRNHVMPFTLAEVEILCDGAMPILPGRYYHCPTCREYIHDPPTEIPLLRDVVTSITKGLGPDVKRAECGAPADPATWWAVFFKT